MPKFRPLPPIASAPITQDHAREREEPLRRAHEVEALQRFLAFGSAPSAAGCAIRRERPIMPSAACVASTAVNSETSVPMPSDEREALHPGRGEDEQDERRHERHDVGVDDRRDAAFVALGDAGGHRSAVAYLLLDAFEDDDVRVRRDADREDQARDARQRQRDRDQLDQREEVDAVDDQRRRPRSRPARGRRRAGTARRRRSRRCRAIRPWCSACLPSVAETCDWLISSSLSGSAPVFSRLARRWARADREAAGDLRAVGARRCRPGCAGSRCTGPRSGPGPAGSRSAGRPRSGPGRAGAARCRAGRSRA